MRRRHRPRNGRPWRTVLWPLSWRESSLLTGPDSGNRCQGCPDGRALGGYAFPGCGDAFVEPADLADQIGCDHLPCHREVIGWMDGRGAKLLPRHQRSALEAHPPGRGGS